GPLPLLRRALPGDADADRVAARGVVTSLRIAHVTGERGFSGGEVQVFLLLEGLRARGHESVLVCPPGSRSEQEATRLGFETYAVPMRSALSPLGVWRVARALRAAGPDLVHLHTGRANALGGA